jgi:hypothetical protein
MSSERPEYYRSRAAEERKAAASAPNAGIFRFHDELAAMYERMAKEAERELALAD